MNLLVQTMRGNIDAIYDITVGYPDYIPENEMGLFAGKFPKQIHLHCKRYPIETIPTTEKDLEEWCNERWIEKEKMLQKFYAEKVFPGKIISNPSREASLNARKWLTFTVWVVLMIFLGWLLWKNSWARWYLLFAFVLNYVVGKFFDGWDAIECKMLTLREPKPKTN